DAGLVDAAGGTVVAGNKAVPWATFEQKVGRSQQIFVRAFKNGQWVTQGSPASLNIDPTAEADAPSNDFAGAGRQVLWGAWYHPVPWIIWEENDGPVDGDSTRQIFVAKGVKQTAAGTPCTGFKPSEANNMNGFCFQQVGLERFASAQSTPPDDTVDPSLNIDPTRAGVEPDIAFTGKDDKVVWTVWYEEGESKIPGLRSNEMVFAAKAVANPSADGGFQWVA